MAFLLLMLDIYRQTQMLPTQKIKRGKEKNGQASRSDSKVEKKSGEKYLAAYSAFFLEVSF